MSNNEVFEDEIPADEISKRAIQSARVTFRKLKSTFVSLAGNKGSRGRPGLRSRSCKETKPLTSPLQE